LGNQVALLLNESSGKPRKEDKVKKELKVIGLGVLAICLLVPIYSLAEEAKTDSAATPAASAPKSAHVMWTPAAIKWGEMPPGLPKGAQFTVLAGDPGMAGLFTVRIKMPAGYRVAPHWHPTDEHVTVISGTFNLGMGEKFEKDAMQELPAGGYALLPAEGRHYAWTKSGATVQVSGNGPFAINYVNPEDDPRNAKPEK
jgi:quercetin dioxygenase-like cupin family protein